MDQSKNNQTNKQMIQNFINQSINLVQITSINHMNIQTADECRTKFDEVKFRKIQARYIVYQIVQQKIVLQRLGAKNQTWEEFVNSLPDKQYRYCVFDFEFTNEDKMAISKMIFINWSPDTAPIKGRVLYATAKESFKKYLDLNTKDFTLCSKGDMTEKDLIKELSH